MVHNDTLRSNPCGGMA